jgi:hypothetical protein
MSFTEAPRLRQSECRAKDEKRLKQWSARGQWLREGPRSSGACFPLQSKRYCQKQKERKRGKKRTTRRHDHHSWNVIDERITRRNASMTLAGVDADILRHAIVGETGRRHGDGSGRSVAIDESAVARVDDRWSAPWGLLDECGTGSDCQRGQFFCTKTFRFS